MRSGRRGPASHILFTWPNLIRSFYNILPYKIPRPLNFQYLYLFFAFFDVNILDIRVLNDKLTL